MNICFLCNEYPPATHGGIGHATRTLARELAARGHGVKVIGFTFRSESVADVELDAGVEVRRLKFERSTFGWVKARRELFQMVSAWAHAGEIDIVEAPDYEGLAAGWPALPIPVVTRLHGSASYFAIEMGKRPNWKTRLLEKASLRRADYRCSCSRYTAEKTHKLFRLQGPIPVVLYNSVEVSPTAVPARRSKTSVVFTGTLTAKKGVVSLIQAWRIVNKRRPDAELHMFGKDGRTDSGQSMQGYLQSLLPADVMTSVHFHQHVTLERLREAFRTACVAVFPSYSEAFALGPMEAMAEGCPTIYSQRSSGKELIDDGKNGLLIEPDNPENIASAILGMLSDPFLADELGRAGKNTIEERFSPGTRLQENVEFYSRCIEAFRTNLAGRSATVLTLAGRASR